MALSTSLPPIDHSRIVAAIDAAEQRTSGELRVVISKETTTDALATAQQHFNRLGMAKTTARNGVLIFVAPNSRTFAVIGDAGVHEKCGEAFWRELADAMTEHFRRGEFEQGIILGLERAGALLAMHFPRLPDDKNELPNDVDET